MVRFDHTTVIKGKVVRSSAHGVAGWNCQQGDNCQGPGCRVRRGAKHKNWRG